MRLSNYLQSLTKPELEELKDYLNLTDEEIKIFDALSKGKSNVQIADMCVISLSTVCNRVKHIYDKVKRVRW